MQEENNGREDLETLNCEIRRELFIFRLKTFPIIGNFVSLPEFVKTCKEEEREFSNEESKDAEYDMEKVKLWTLILQFVSAVARKNEQEQDSIRSKILNHKLMQEPEAQEFKEYLSDLEYSQKESINSIVKYGQELLVLIKG